MLHEPVVNDPVVHNRDTSLRHQALSQRPLTKRLHLDLMRLPGALCPLR